jgi:phosphoglycolate phosphatase
VHGPVPGAAKLGRVRPTNGSRTAVLFDLDGTLTDSAPGILASIRHAMSRLGLPDVDEATLRSFLGPPLPDCFRRTWPLDEPGVRRAVEAYREYYAARGLFENDLYPGIGDLVRNLRARGRTLLVATSKPTPFADRVLEHFGIRDCFRAVVGADLDPSHPRADKSEVVAAALALLDPDGRARAAMVGDREPDVRAARAHGIVAVGVAYGYAAPGELEMAAPDVLVRTVAELGEWLTA